MNFIVKLILQAIAILITSYLLLGVHVEGFFSAFMLAAILGIFNVTLKPLLIILTIPITIVSFGLFLLVINAGVLLLGAKIIPGTSIDGFWWAILFGFIVTVISSILEKITEQKAN